MKTNFGFIDPSAIMGVVIALIILGVGVFALFVTVTQLKPAAGTSYDAASNYTNATFRPAMDNATNVASQVFNIIGVVLIIGAIMSIVGLVYNYVR